MLPKLNNTEKVDQQDQQQHIDLVDQIKDNRQRLQKSMRAGQLNIVKSIKALHVDIVSFFDFQRDRAELHARQDRLNDDHATTAPNNDDPIADRIEDSTDRGFSALNLLSRSLIAFSVWTMGLDDIILAVKHGLTVVRDFVLRPLHALASSKIILGIGDLATSALRMFGNVRKSLVSVIESISLGSVVLKPLQSLFSSISSVGAVLKNFAITPALNAIRSIGSWLSQISGLSAITRTAGSIFLTAGRFLRYLGGPWTIALFAAIDATVGFIEGFKTGGWLGGIEGAWLGLVHGMVTKPFDLIKDAIGWIVGKLGFDEWKESIRAFSFTEQFDMMWSKLKDSVSTMFSDLLWVWDNSGQVWANIKTEMSTFIDQKFSKIKNLLLNTVPDLIDRHVVTPLSNFGDTLGSYLAIKLFGDDQPEEKKKIGSSISTIIAGAWDSITSWLGSKLSIDRIRAKIDGIAAPVDSVVSSVTTFVSGIFDLINGMIPSIQSIELGILKMIRSRIEKEGSIGDVLKYGLGLITGDKFDLDQRIRSLEGGNNLTGRLGAASSDLGPGGQSTTVAIQGGPVSVDQRSPSTQVHNVYYYQYHTPSGHSHTSLPSRQ